MTDAPQQNNLVAIKKYPNRRYYDSTQSRHVTLEDIHRMICDGKRVQVTDSKTNTDITSRVLAQIILEMDSLKLSMFPSPLLHKLIQSNEKIVQEFVEVYFNKALDWFLTSREMYEDQFRRAVGLETQGTTEGQASPPDLGIPNPLSAVLQPAPQPPPPAGHTSTENAQLNERVEQLSKRVENLQSQLHDDKSHKA